MAKSGHIADDEPCRKRCDGLAEEAVVQGEAINKIIPFCPEEVPHDRLSNPAQKKYL